MSTQQETETPKVTKTIHTLSPDQAYDIQQHYVCAGCYGQVIAQPTDRQAGTWTATCDTPDCTTPGFVTRKWAERAQAKSAEQLLEARQVLRDAAPWMNPHRGKTTDQLLSELGF